MDTHCLRLTQYYLLCLKIAMHISDLFRFGHWRKKKSFVVSLVHRNYMLAECLSLSFLRFIQKSIVFASCALYLRLFANCPKNLTFHKLKRSIFGWCDSPLYSINHTWIHSNVIEMANNDRLYCMSSRFVFTTPANCIEARFVNGYCAMHRYVSVTLGFMH